MMVVPLLWETQIRVGHAEWPIYLYEFKYFNDEVFPKRAKVHGKIICVHIWGEGWAKYNNLDFTQLPTMVMTTVCCLTKN
jgi:hypothetical protein